MLKVIKQTSTAVVAVKSRVKFPERFKGTIIEKFAVYWKNMFIDYRQMLQELRSDMQDDPVKALKWTTGIITAVLLARNNPNELDFKDSLKRVSNDVIMVSDDCRNPKSAEHLNYLDSCYNAGVLHYLSIGIASFMYVSEINNDCDLYKKHCSYLQPSYFGFPSRIVDIGIMGRWWNIYRKTASYDVNF